MDKKMFCFQCEQTAGCSGCTGAAGVCGKDAETSELQDRLTGALIGLARSAEGNRTFDSTDRAMLSGLFTTVTNVNFNPETIRKQISLVHREKEKLVPSCGGCSSPCGKNDDYVMKQLWEEQEDIRSLKSLILFGLRGMAAYAYHAMVLGYSDQTVNRFFYEGMALSLIHI